MSEEEIRKALIVQARRLQGGDVLAIEDMEWYEPDGEHELLIELEREQERQRSYGLSRND